MKILKAFLLTMVLLACCVAAVVVCANLPAPAADVDAAEADAALLSEVEPLQYNASAPTVTTSGEVTLDMNNYQVVYKNKLALSINLCEQIAERLGELTGQTVATKYETNHHRLLVVGDISSSDSLVKRAASLCSVSASGNEFGIAVVGRNIVIVGVNYVCALMGAQYFIDTYLGENASVQMTMPAVVKANYATAASTSSRLA